MGVRASRRKSHWVLTAVAGALLTAVLLPRAGLSDSADASPSPEASSPLEPVVLHTATPSPEAPPAATPNPDPAGTATPVIIVIELQSASPSPASTPSPSPSAAPAEATPEPEPTPTPAPTPDPTVQEREKRIETAAAALRAYRRPNRLKQYEIDDILASLPDDLALGRALVVVKAYSLIGRITYEWGGKSSEIGWDGNWGNRAIVVENGVATAGGDVRGLDCSGFVRWCFINAAGTKAIADNLGSGTYKQWINSDEIELDAALPGDLVFTDEVGRANHDGIVVKNNGNGDIMVIHCAKDKGVVLERAPDAGFRFARRPDVLRGANLASFDASLRRHANTDAMADLRYLLAVKDW